MRHFILGTDWWDDCDDAVAIRLLARAHKAGQIRLEGIGINACMEDSVAALDGFLHVEGVCDVPIGIDLRADDFGGRLTYQKNLVPMAKKYRANTDAEDAAELYCRLLKAADEKVEIIEIGFLNVIAGVLEREPELFRQKVAKAWVMAGRWNEDGGKENNFARNARAREAASRFCAQCPVPVTFLGWEVGATVVTGCGLPEGDVLAQVMRDHGSANGRYSWDPMLARLALTGDESRAGYDTVRGTASVDAVSGANHFAVCEQGLHRYVVKTMPDAYYAQLIDAAIR